MILSPTFIDTNIILYILNFKDEDITEWLSQLYEKIYIHKDIYDEIYTNKKAVDELLKHENWLLFDPDSEYTMSDSEYNEYTAYHDNVRDVFLAYQFERKNKQSLDTGDISILASCLHQKVKLITSNDKDFIEVITREGYSLAADTIEEEDIAIEVIGLAKLGVLLISNGICERKKYKKFLSANMENSKEIIKHIDKQLG